LIDTLVYYAGLAAALGLAGLLVAQVGLMTRFIRILRGPAPQSPSDAELPEVMVVLCLRGADPFLDRCFDAVLALDYPRYRVRIVVDSREDPAWARVEQFLARTRPANVDVVLRRTLYATAGLKCSSLLDAIDELDESIKVVAQLDADVIPHRTWLRELVAPLGDERVGIACGNRWYVPGDTVGSTFRYLWNAPAVVTMQWQSIAWGGSLAIRAEILRRLDLRELWSRTLCEDTPLQHELRRANLEMRFVPTLMMLNRESCTLSGIVPWIRRQLLIVRLHHPAWPMITVHAAATTGTLALALFAGFAALVRGAPAAHSLIPLAAFAGYFVLSALLLWRLESAVMRVVAARGEPLPGTPASTVLRAFLWIPFTQFLYTAVVASVPLARRIEWRGVSYHVERRGVRMVEYRPYAPRTLEPDVTHSL
jgi:cellulose synthase/poly-beta-1,6-N-acetylglucosamine synthase-like glycosyltransferase